MNFTLPEARRERMEQLLEYLGSRSEDFKKCFDTESEWCWKYADLMLRGLDVREMEYAEKHHIVPASFYGKRRCKSTDHHNETTLTFQEHLYAHFCLAFCSIGIMKGKMSCAFHYMFNIGPKKTKLFKEDDMLAYISSKDLERIKLEIPDIKRVTEDGRHHRWEVSDYEYNKEIYNARRDKKSETNKALYRRTKAKRKKYNKKYYKENKDTISLNNKSYYDEHKEQINARSRKNHAKNREENNRKSREYYAANEDRLREYARDYSATHREERRLKAINYRAAKKAAGYCVQRDPVTGKAKWVFVGLPVQEVAA